MMTDVIITRYVQQYKLAYECIEQSLRFSPNRIFIVIIHKNIIYVGTYCLVN